MGPGTTIWDPAWLAAIAAAAWAIYRTLNPPPASGSEQPQPAPPSPPPPPPPVIQQRQSVGVALFESVNQAADLKVSDLLAERLVDLKARRMIGELYQSIRPEDYKL